MREMKKQSIQKNVPVEKINTLNSPKKRGWNLQKLLPPALLSLLATIIYTPSFWYPFQFDDLANISKRFAIRYDNPLSRWSTNSRWFGDWLNTLNFQFGRFDPFYYRIVNFVIHLTAGWFLFFLIYNLCKALEEKTFLWNNALLVASTTVGLFLLHPVQTQTVSYVIQARIEGLATLFILATLHFLTQAITTQSTIIKRLSLLLGCTFATLSCGTKEIVIVIPLLLIIVDWFFCSRQQWSQFKTRLLGHTTFLLSFFGLMVHYLGSNFTVRAITLSATTGNNRGNILTSHADAIITPFTYLMSQLKIVVHYITMFFWPFNISVEYDWKIAQSFFSLDVIAPFILLAVLFIFILRTITNQEKGYLTFGLVWFFICIAPRSTIIPSPELACDYKTYAASIGILFILGVFFAYVIKNLFSMINQLTIITHLKKTNTWIKEPSLVTALLLVIMLPISFATLQRNKVWQSPVDFWQDNALKAPNKARVHNNLGVALSEAGKIDESIVAYQRAIELDKHYQDPLSNLAVAYSLNNEIDKAIDSLRMAIHLSPDYPEAYNNLGSLLLNKKNYADAEKVLNHAIKLRPYYGKAHYNLARMHEELNNPEKVWVHLKRASQGDLDIPEVFFKLGQSSLRVEKYDEAAQAFETAIEHGLRSEQAWFNLGNSYFMLGDHKKAQPIFEQLVRGNPQDSRYAYNLGETFFQCEDYTKALAMFRKTTSMPKPVAQAFLRVAKCLEHMKKETQAQDYLQELLALNAPEEFQKVVKNELTRLSIQTKVNAGNGSIRLSDLNNALSMSETSTV